MRQPPRIITATKYPVTAGTILLATAITVASLGKFIDVTPLVENGEVRRWQLWRLATSSLPHADPLHLIFNLYWTWVFGTLVEEVFGHWRTLMLFLLLAVVSGAAEFALLRGGIGLSGVGYGLFGLLWVLSKRDARFANSVDSKTVQLFVGWFFFCIFLTYSGYPIGNIAHATGFVIGAILGWSITSQRPLRLAGFICIEVIFASTVAGATVARPWVNLARYVGGDTAKYAGADEARLGYDALMAQENEQSLRWFNDAIRMNPNDSYSFFSLGIAYQRLSKYELALTAYNRASALDPGNEQYRQAAKALEVYTASKALP